MAGARLKIARTAREAVHKRIVAWLDAQSGTKKAQCERLRLRPAQLHALVHDGVERCSLEYLLDLWERCGGTYSLILANDSSQPSKATPDILLAIDSSRHAGNG
jgi:hypothetical protein